MADGRAVRLLLDKCVRIELKTRFCAARHVRIDSNSYIFVTEISLKYDSRKRFGKAKVKQYTKLTTYMPKSMTRQSINFLHLLVSEI